MKKLLILTLLLLPTLWLTAQTDLEKLNQRVIDVEDILQWLKNWGLPLGGISVLAVLGMLYAQFKGLKKKAEEEVKKALEKNLPSIVKQEIEKHPLTSIFAQELAARESPILIVSQKGKDQTFVDYLKNNGFSKTHSLEIDKLGEVDINDYKLILLDNRKEQKLSQEKMETVLSLFKEGCKYFYFNDHNQWWTPISDYAKSIKISGHASSIATLPNRLTEALKA